jgi:hypothetical protein
MKENSNKIDRKIQLSNYQKISKKMSSQKSSITKEMFNNNHDLWIEYHDARDFSFQGYDNQDEIR